MRTLIAFLIAAFTASCADVNITNVTTASGTVASDYVLGVTNTASSVANGKTRLIKVGSIAAISTNAINSLAIAKDSGIGTNTTFVDSSGNTWLSSFLNTVRIGVPGNMVQLTVSSNLTVSGATNLFTGVITAKEFYGTNLILYGTITAPTLNLQTLNTLNLVVTNGITNNVGFYGNIFGTNGAFTGPVLSTSSSSNSPAQNELVQAQWVRNLFAGGGAFYYSSTNIDIGVTNTTKTGLTYDFSSVVPPYFNRTYTAVVNNQYLGFVITTNYFAQISGQITVSAYLERTGGTGGPTVTVHPEIYYMYADGTTNWTLGDWEAQNQAITTGTNLYEWVVSVPLTIATNSQGFRILRAFKVGTATGATTPNVVFHGGTNFPSHVTLPVPSTGTGNAFLGANQTFTGLNTFSQAIDTPNLTTLRTTNNLVVGATNITVNMDVAALRVVVTNNIILTNFTGLAVGTSKVKTIILDVVSGGPHTLTLPAAGASYGIYWATNAPPATEPYTSLTNGSKYILTIASWDTNLTRSMYECK